MFARALARAASARLGPAAAARGAAGAPGAPRPPRGPPRGARGGGAPAPAPAPAAGRGPRRGLAAEAGGGGGGGRGARREEPLSELYGAEELEAEEFEGYGTAAGWAGWAAAGLAGYGVYSYRGEDLKRAVEEKRRAEAWPEAALFVAEAYANWRVGIDSQVDKYTMPSSDKLLPDLPPQMAAYTRTLVVDLDETLIHSDWNRRTGWKVYKRPGAEEFIKQMAQYYEIVVYTHQLYTYADPIIEALDPERYVSFRLYKDSTLWKDGHHYRDLGKLNRDPEKVLFLTADPSASTSAENTLPIRGYRATQEQSRDTQLLDYMPFLEAIVRNQVQDVRAVVKSYQGTNIPDEFRARMQAMQSNLRSRGAAPKATGRW